MILSLAIALGSSNDIEKMEVHLAKLIKPFAERMLELTEREDALTNNDVLMDIKDDLGRLSAIFGKI